MLDTVTPATFDYAAYEARELRRKRIRFANSFCKEHPERWLLRVGHLPIGWDSLTDAALAEVCGIMVTAFWRERRMARLSREGNVRSILIQEPTETPWWVKSAPAARVSALPVRPTVALSAIEK